jgi:hypothetical protein
MRLQILRKLLGLLTLFWGVALNAQAQAFIVFDPPNASFTETASINAGGDVTGIFGDSSQDFKQRGFVRDRFGKFTVFDAPNASFTDPSSINNHGDVAGYFGDANQGNKQRGFVRDRFGKFTVFDAPNASSTGPTSINENGDVAGFFADTSPQNFTGFVRDRFGNFTLLGFAAFSINDEGEVAGNGFVRDRQGNVICMSRFPSQIPPPCDLLGLGISNKGDVTGVFTEANDTHGFVRDREGNVTVFDAPSAGFTAPFTITDNGDVAGYFSDTSLGTNRGFVRDRLGNFTVFDAPNSEETLVLCCGNGPVMNGRGDVTGYFRDISLGTKRGFVRRAHTSPEHDEG